MTNLALAALDDRTGASAPWMRAMQAPKPRSWQQVAAMRQPAANPAATPNAALDASRRLRVAERTPSGEPQPPEVADVDASARVPNDDQPMAGEFHDGREVERGEPSFFPPSMPPPTGTANNVGVPRGTHLFGAAVGMTTRGPAPDPSLLRLAGLTQPNAAPPVSNLAALPHFADGGTLGAGGAGVVGENGEEEIQALPGGGVTVKPLATGPAEANPAEMVADMPGSHAIATLPRADRSAALAAMVPQPNAAAFRASAAPAAVPSDLTPVAPAPITPRAQRELYGYGTGIAAPPPEESAQGAYMKALRAEQAEVAPDPTDARYRTPMWRKLAAIAAGALAGGTQRNGAAAERVGEDTASIFAPNLYARDEQQFNQQQAREQKQLGNLYNAVRAEDTENGTAERAWAADQQGRREQQSQDATAEYRAEQQARQGAEDSATARYREQQLARHPHEVKEAGDGTMYNVDMVTGESTPVTAGGRPLSAYHPPNQAQATRAQRTEGDWLKASDDAIRQKNSAIARIEAETQSQAAKDPADAGAIYQAQMRSAAEQMADFENRYNRIADAYGQPHIEQRVRVRMQDGQTGTMRASEAVGRRDVQILGASK